jgi:hypothetical protein
MMTEYGSHPANEEANPAVAGNDERSPYSRREWQPSPQKIWDDLTRNANNPATTTALAAKVFLESIGLDPTPDTIDQLALAFVPALRIISERGYDPNGKSWRECGWRGQVYEIIKRCKRLMFNSWSNNRFDANNAVDLINYAGFYLRMKNIGRPWGEWGDPQ